MGLDTVSYCLLCEELGRADSSVRGIVSVSNGLFGKTVAKWGTRGAEARAAAPARDRRGARLLRAHRAGLRLRPGGARDARRARRRRLGADRLEDLHHARLVGGDRARLRAHRRRGPERDHVLRRPDRRGGLRGAADRRASSGCARRTRPSSSSTACACRTPSGLGDEGDGLQGRDVGARQRPHLARRRLRRDRAGLPRRVRRLREGAATQFGRPIARFQLVQELLADIARRDRGGAPARPGAPRRSPTRAAPTPSRRRSRSTTRARRPCAPRTPPCRCTAATATWTNTPSAKYLRDARVTTLYEGTSQIQKLIIGRALTGRERIRLRRQECPKPSSSPPSARRSGAPRKGSLVDVRPDDLSRSRSATRSSRCRSSTRARSST